MQRVKVYFLNDEGLWDDRGTGTIRVETAEHPSSDVHIIVERDSTPLINHKVVPDLAYQRQSDDTIITWSEGPLGNDIALSFQEAFTCSQVWNEIQRVQDASLSPRLQGARLQERQWRGSEAFDSGTAHHATYEESAGLLHGPHLPSDPGDALDDEATREASCLGPGSMDLPEPTLASLPAIAARLTEPSVFDREALVHRLLSPDYLTRLRALFGDAEDLEDVDSLRRLHVIFRGAFLLHDATLIEALVSEDAYMDVLGALEYEPGVDPAARPRHRAWMRERATFREPVRVADEGVRRRIHETYRLSFVKDVALPRVLDDATTATLRSLALFNSVEILVTLTADEQVFPELFARLAAAAPGSDEWRDLVRFLQELAAQAKHLQASQRANLFEKLVALGLFDAMGRVLEAASDPAARLRAADVLLVAALHDPAPLRAHLLAPEAGRALFERLIAALLSPDAARTGMPEQVLELLRVLLDPESMEAAVEQDAFIDAFYATHAGALLSAVVEGSRGLADGGGAGEREAEKAGAADVGANEPIPKPTSASGNGDVSEAAGPRTPEPPSHTSAPSAQSLGLVLELLCFCVTQHSYRIKYYVLRNNVVEKVLRLLRRRELWLRAAALRFLRTCLGMLDDFYNRYLVKNGLLEPVLAAFCANGTRYNLLNSAALELLEFLWRENAKGLLASLVASPQWEAAKRLDATGTFARLLAKHEQNQDREQPPGSTEAGAEAGAQAAPSNGGALAQQARTEAALQQRRIRGEREEDEDEDKYFESEDDGDGDGDGSAAAKAPGPAPGSVRALPPLKAPGSDEGPPMFPFPGRLVDYDDDDDALPIGVMRRKVRGSSPPLQKRFRPASPA